MRSPGRTAALLGLLFGLAGTGTSAATVVLPELASELGVGPSTAAWTISVYAVMLAVATPLHGRLADAYGLRGPLVVGLSAMVGGSVVAALAPTFPVLLAGRVVQGFGGASVPVLATALISTLWSGPQRSSALGRLAGIAAAFSALGPLLGGALEEIGGWRLAIAVPALGVVSLPWLARRAPAGGTGERIDRVGALFVAATAAGLVLLLQSPSSGPVTAMIGAVMLAVGVPAVAIWVRRRPTGFLPRVVVTNPVVLRSAFATAAIPAAWFALLIGVPLTAAEWGWSPFEIGLLLLPAVAVGIVAPWLSRTALGRLGPRRTIVTGVGIAVVAMLTGAAGAALDSPVLLAFAVLALNTAFGIGQPAMISAVDGAVDAAERGIALGIASLVFLVGASIGAALVGGLAEVTGIAVALCVLVALPVMGLTVLLLGPRQRTPVRV
ncbi:MFS transporter [Pseudonocardia thermophila]|uniref:MFS transporter n=1 Tax=Pseudonocardia thermophila TaxID=1848 RepID=UPI00248DCEED|nr:MFS transporter [Pseudonocardia thermophila]